MSQYRLGLVLSGGGAKGAYEAGVVRALARFGYEPDAVAGASIGALNGAIVATAPDMATAANELEAVWTGLDSESVVKLDCLSASRVLALTAMHVLMRIGLGLNPVTMVAVLAQHTVRNLFTPEDAKYLGMLDESPLEEVLDAAVDFERLLGDSGRDLYASVYPSSGGSIPGLFLDLTRYIASRGGSVFPRVQDHSREDARKLLMASAALPLAFRAVDIDGRTYRDGGMGDRLRAQGNTPAAPLAEAGCTHAVVVTLSQGAPWDRNEWSEMIPLEVRPSFDVDDGRWFTQLIDFDPVRIRSLIARGEEDGMRCLERVAEAATLIDGLRESQQQLVAKETSDPEANTKYDLVMDRLRLQNEDS